MYYMNFFDIPYHFRFGRLFWKTNHALTRDDLERKYLLERLEKDGLVHVENILGSSHWTFQTV